MFVDVDEIVQGTADTNSASWAYVSTVLYSPFDKMNERRKKQVVDNIVAVNKRPKGRYCLEATSVADEITL